MIGHISKMGYSIKIIEIFKAHVKTNANNGFLYVESEINNEVYLFDVTMYGIFCCKRLSYNRFLCLPCQKKSAVLILFSLKKRRGDLSVN